MEDRNLDKKDLDALSSEFDAFAIEQRIKQIARGIERLELDRAASAGTPPVPPTPTATAAPTPPERKRDAEGRLVFSVKEFDSNVIPLELRRAGNYAVEDVPEPDPIPVGQEEWPVYSMDALGGNLGNLPAEVRKSGRYRIVP